MIVLPPDQQVHANGGIYDVLVDNPWLRPASPLLEKVHDKYRSGFDITGVAERASVPVHALER